MKNILKTFDRTINEIGKKFVTRFREELKQQDHIATGNLSDTMHYDLVEGKDSIDLVVQTRAKYVDAVNEGQNAGTYPNLDAIMDWMDAKKIPYGSQSEKVSIASRIAKRIQMEGSPTKGAKQFSFNGFRTGFINRVVGSNERHFLNDIDKSISTDINNIFKQLPKQV
jgi:hypothetical protein